MSLAQTHIVATFSVDAGKHTRVHVPVTADLEGIRVLQPDGVLQLFEITAGKNTPVASQLAAGSPGTLTWILDGKTLPGMRRNYELRMVSENNALERRAPAEHAVKVVDSGESLQVTIGDAPVFAYRYTPQGVPDGVDQIYDRSGFIHPLWSPEGEVLTRIQPSDHYHHYGIWNPWTSTTFRGKEVDFWNLAKGQGTVRAAGIQQRIQGDVFGGFRALHTHVVTDSLEETIAVNEQWEVKAWRADPENKVWLVDFVSTLSPATNEPLTINAYRYQGFSLRATERWNDKTARLLSSAGFDKTNANGTRARWLDVNGESDTKAGTSGVLFMSHPNNYNFPEQLRIWPVGMNKGVENVYINFNPAQEQDLKLEPGRAYTLQYRMLVYDGSIPPAEAEQYWRDFADPPRVQVHATGALAGARVLLYTKNGEGYVHDNIPQSIAAIEQLGNTNGFAVDLSEDPAVFVSDSLLHYDALIFSNTNNETFDTEAQRQGFVSYIEQGGGFVGIHSASGSERNWPWFSKLLGGKFARHAPRQDFSVQIIDPSHPSTAFLPATWDIADDECYYLKALNPGIRVLLAADLNTVSDDEKGVYPGDTFGDRFPIAWYQEFAGGRQWYTSLGHRAEHYKDAQFIRHILGGIQWVVNGYPRAPIPQKPVH